MKDFDIYFPEINYHFPFSFVEGTGAASYLFGDREKTSIAVNDFFISKFPVTQQLWGHIMAGNPSHFKGPDRPVENVSFHDVTQENGFLHQLNSGWSEPYKMTFRLPTESEWEYAARGGKHWKDDFRFSGSHDMNDAGWYELNSGEYQDPAIIASLKNQEKGTETHDVGQKKANQLGIFDMCGNVWEWCQDFFERDIDKIPKDGTPYSEERAERVLRGGCHHNGAVHCTVSKRYAIIPEARDECIGFRLAASVNN